MWKENSQAEEDNYSTITGSTKSTSFSDDESLDILFEIVGAYQLSIEEQESDVKEEGLQPYCVVKYGGKQVHKSNPAEEKGKNPIWTISSKSLFLVNDTPWGLAHKELEFYVYVHNNVFDPLGVSSRAYFLGKASIDAATLLAQYDEEERVELSLKGEFDTELSRGTLAIRFRLANNSDKRFLGSSTGRTAITRQASSDEYNRIFEGGSESFSEEEHQCHYSNRPLAKMVTERNDTQAAQQHFVKAISSAFSYRTSLNKSGEQCFRVKPNPDPKNRKETEFMTKREMSFQTRQPSHSWVEAGSGTLGKLYLEILSCHDLPNLDVGEAIGNFSDCFVNVVFEDVSAQTPVIDDELSPHWLPWTQRAFSFGIMHPSSFLYLAVFDYDIGIGFHDPIGRVAINIGNFERDTAYTLKYNLYPSSNVTERTPVGAITIRLRLEFPDEKKALLAALKPRPQFHINSRKEKTLRVNRYTCFGMHDNAEKFDLNVTRSYVNEIFEFKRDLGYCIGDGFRSLMFWRGQVEVFHIPLPVHSFLFFCGSTTLIERPSLTVPFLLLSVAWILIASQLDRCQRPSPWHRCKSFWHFLEVLRTGQGPSSSLKRIHAFEGHEEMKEYQNAWKKRVEADDKLAATHAELMEELFTIGDENIQTKVAGSAIPLDILERLGRWQAMIGRWCCHFRYIKMVFTWEESVMSFRIAAYFLVGGIVSLFVPWSFLLTWTARLAVYGCFGPHMKIVDIYFRLGAEDDKKIRKALNDFHEQSKFARARREEAVKLKDLKKRFFGKYITNVPAYNLARHHDRPLPESAARICKKSPENLNDRYSPWIPGQQFLGVMIPQPVHAGHRSRDEKALEALKSRIEGLKRDDAVHVVRKVSDHDIDESLPPAVGYELIIEDENDDYYYDSDNDNYDDHSCDKNVDYDNNDENKSENDIDYNTKKYDEVLAKRAGGDPLHSSLSNKVVVVDTCRYSLRRNSRRRSENHDEGYRCRERSIVMDQSIAMDESVDDMGIEIVDIGQFAADLNEIEEVVCDESVFEAGSCEQSVFGSGSSIQSEGMMEDDDLANFSNSIQHQLGLDKICNSSIF